nr:RbsD/FucU domain-containing protein [uncultured Microbacterium sp.]
MLKNIDPLLSPELLGIMARMGHGDTLAIVDQNFPSYAAGVPVVRADAADSTRMARAVFSLLPIDTFIDRPITRMLPGSVDDDLPEVQSDFLRVAEEAEQRTLEFAAVDRFTFYDLVRGAMAVLATGETRPYGCFLVTKGVVQG